MKTNILVITVLLFLSISYTIAQNQLSLNASEDKPVSADSIQWVKLDQAIKPYVEIARKTFPSAKSKFLLGLPDGYYFFVTTRIRDSHAKTEQIFIHVKELNKGIVIGDIASDLYLVSGYSKGQLLKFKEEEIIDWTITSPDGSEEGNVVGKFLDNYKP